MGLDRPITCAVVTLIVLHDEGRRAASAVPVTMIRSDLNCFSPMLAIWASRVTSLREITREDIQAALDDQPPGHGAISYRPCTACSGHSNRNGSSSGTPLAGSPARDQAPARPDPTDQLRGLIDRAGSPMAELIVALIAIHALGKQETAHPLLAIAWMRERRRLWSLTTNPHLLVSQVTAADQTCPPVAHTVMDAISKRLGLTPGKLRRDRILDEASHTADPVHLMRVFGISVKTAMTYIQAAHPERRPTLPR